MKAAHGRLALLVAALAGCGSNSGRAPRFIDSDVHRFVALTTATGDTSCDAVRRYFADATAGLRAYASKFDAGPSDLCRARRQSPELYTQVANRLTAFDSAGAAVALAESRFRSLAPDASFPPVYLVVGTGISGGTTTRFPNRSILIGAERVGSLDVLPRMVLHELVHTQQHYPWLGGMTGGPAFLRGTLLRASIVEGSADFLADLVLGFRTTARDSFGLAHEAELWRDFQAAMHGKTYDDWLYNGWNRAHLNGRPPDLGYFVGYRITRAFYDVAPDKKAAVQGILHIRDFDEFLGRSGYHGVNETRPGG